MTNHVDNTASLNFIVIITDQVNINVPARVETPANYQIVNNSGQAVVAKGNLKVGENHISTASLIAGTYFAVTQNGAKSSAVKLVKL